MRGPAGSMAAQRLNGTAGKDARLRELVADGGTPGRAKGFLGGFWGRRDPPGARRGAGGVGGCRGMGCGGRCGTPRTGGLVGDGAVSALTGQFPACFFPFSRRFRELCPFFSCSVRKNPPLPTHTHREKKPGVSATACTQREVKPPRTPTLSPSFIGGKSPY